jgi:hypothetical protein
MMWSIVSAAVVLAATGFVSFLPWFAGDSKELHKYIYGGARQPLKYSGFIGFFVVPFTSFAATWAVMYYRDARGFIAVLGQALVACVLINAAVVYFLLRRVS